MNKKTSTAIAQLNLIKNLGKKMRLAAEGWKYDWQTLIAIILSARTRDEVTIKVCKKLFSEYKSLSDIASSDFDKLSLIIRPINYYKNKTKNILNCSKNLIADYKGKIPHDFKNLISLPGVGRKTANVFLAEYGQDNIGVDTHLAYCSHKLGWTKNISPHKIEIDLHNLFPKKFWRVLNPSLVRFGKSYLSKKKKDELLEQISNAKIILASVGHN